MTERVHISGGAAGSVKEKPAPASFRAAHPQLAAVRLDEALRDRETEANAAAIGLRLPEPIEQAVDEGSRE